MSLMGVAPVISPGVVRSHRVPSLGGYTRTRGGIILLVGCFSGMVFGAIHCGLEPFFSETYRAGVMACSFPCDIMCTNIHTHLLLLRRPEVVWKVLFGPVVQFCFATRQFCIYCCASYTNCTRFPQFSNSTLGRVRYSSLDQVHSTLVVIESHNLPGCSGSLDDSNEFEPS
jgi:hypothetical protein